MVPPARHSAVTSRYGRLPLKPRITNAGKVKIAPAATASPADATVCATLFSRIVEPPRTRRIAIDTTAAGILADTVSPAYKPRYAFAAPRTTASTTPITIARGVSSRTSSTAEFADALFVDAVVTPDAISRASLAMQAARLSLTEIFERTRVEHVVGLDPSATRLIDAELKQPETLGRVRVARDHEFDARVFRGDAIGVDQVEPIDLRIDFKRAALARGRAHHLVEIETARCAFVDQQSAGGMPDDIDIRVANRFDDAACHLGRR